MQKSPIKFFRLILLTLLSMLPLYGYNSDNSHIHLVGCINHNEVLSQSELKRKYQEYKPLSLEVKKLKSIKDDLDILVVFGDWCSDSLREVPPLIKTLDKANNKHINVSYIAVSNDKLKPSNEIKSHNITTVPTIIILRNGKEITRFTERLGPQWSSSIYNSVKDDVKKSKKNKTESI